MSKNQENSGFWTTVPGILTALTGLIAAIGVFIGVLDQANLIGKNTPKTESPSMETSETKPTTIKTPKTESSSTINQKFFVIGGQGEYDVNLINSVKDKLGQFPDMKICDSKNQQKERFYLLIGSTTSESEANKLKNKVQSTPNLSKDTYIKPTSAIPFIESSCKPI